MSNFNEMQSTLEAHPQAENTFIFRRVVLGPFSYLFSPNGYKGNEPKYNARIIFSKDSQAAANLFKLMENVAVATYESPDLESWNQQAGCMMPIHNVMDGDKQDPSKAQREYLKGAYQFNLTQKADKGQPKIYDQYCELITELQNRSSRALSTGALVDVIFTVGALKEKKLIYFNLQAIQVIEPATTELTKMLGSRPAMSEDTIKAAFSAQPKPDVANTTATNDAVQASGPVQGAFKF
jgi:hypothetical protein